MKITYCQLFEGSLEQTPYLDSDLGDLPMRIAIPVQRFLVLCRSVFMLYILLYNAEQPLTCPQSFDKLKILQR